MNSGDTVVRVDGREGIGRPDMQVYLVPVGRGRHELYCEVPEGMVEDDTSQPKGVLHGLSRRFRDMMARVEEHGRRAPETGSRSVGGRVGEAVMGWLAARVAEQRLLWHLRPQGSATLVHPADLGPDQAMLQARRILKRDADRHRFWLVVDSIGFVVSGLVAWLPGPNLIAYYFAFRLVGHYLSVRGARHGLLRISWSLEASPALTELREVLGLPATQQETRLLELASRLQLPHLAAFVARAAGSPMVYSGR